MPTYEEIMDSLGEVKDPVVSCSGLVVKVEYFSNGRKEVLFTTSLGLVAAVKYQLELAKTQMESQYAFQ